MEGGGKLLKNKIKNPYFRKPPKRILKKGVLENE
jgi:hypothetical protein